MALELRPNCECCDRDLAPDVSEAFICSFECTFCAECTEERLRHKCPNCGGDLVLRPRRMGAALARRPASRSRVVRTEPCFAGTS